jgi:hypothetical protein
MAAPVFHQALLPSDQRVLFSVRARAAVPQAASPDATEVTPAPVLFLKELIEARKCREIIDRCYPLSQLIKKPADRADRGDLAGPNVRMAHVEWLYCKGVHDGRSTAIRDGPRRMAAGRRRAGHGHPRSRA